MCVFLQSLKANSRHPRSGLLALFGFPSRLPQEKSRTFPGALGPPSRQARVQREHRRLACGCLQLL